jgi:hypothetical protein
LQGIKGIYSGKSGAHLGRAEGGKGLLTAICIKGYVSFPPIFSAQFSIALEQWLSPPSLQRFNIGRNKKTKLLETLLCPVETPPLKIHPTPRPVSAIRPPYPTQQCLSLLSSLPSSSSTANDSCSASPPPTTLPLLPSSSRPCRCRFSRRRLHRPSPAGYPLAQL